MTVLGREQTGGRTYTPAKSLDSPDRDGIRLAGRAAHTMAREAIIGQTLVELADTLVADFDVVELLTRLTDRCVEVFDVTAAGLMLAAPAGDLRVMASSSEAMRVLELFELQAQEGPCLDCFRTGRPVVNENLAAADRLWPRFGPKARAAGSALCKPCRCDCADR